MKTRLVQDAKGRMLISDELGYQPQEPNMAYLFVPLTSCCYPGGSVLTIFNRPVMGWDETPGDRMVARVPHDRLRHHTTTG